MEVAKMFNLLFICLVLISSIHPAPVSLITPTLEVTISRLKPDATTSARNSTTNNGLTIKQDSNTSQTNSTTDYGPTLKPDSITSNCTGLVRHKYHQHFLIAIGSLSLLALLLNFVFFTKICSCNGVSVIVLFGICLFLFNIILSFYGIALAGYLYKGPLCWDKTFCQGFTSIKLLALGSGTWTLIMLTFHHSIKESSNGERDAVFKGIVYVLEGVMLSGVMAVMSWIKLDSWSYLCGILEPITTVEWLLTGIELWFYTIALILIIRYPIYMFRRKKQVEEETLKKRTQEHPIFLMVILSFILWALAFTLTLPRVHIFSAEMAAAIRVCTLMFVIILQPILYTIRGTFCCTGNNCPCSSKKNDAVESVLLVCECTGSETCAACDSEYDPRPRYGDTVFIAPIGAVATSDENLNKELNGKYEHGEKQKDPKVEETEEIIRKNKKRKKNKNEVASPNVVCRSPEVRDTLKSANSDNEHSDNDKENAPLLDKVPKKEVNQKSEVKQRQSKNIESVPLLDDTDGKSNAPKLYPDSSPFKTIPSEDTLDSPNSRNRPSEFPSFINLESAVNVDELPKEIKHPKLQELQRQSPNTAERVSRGPTFYSIDKNNGKFLSERDSIAEDTNLEMVETEKETNPLPEVKPNIDSLSHEEINVDLQSDVQSDKKKKKDTEKKKKRKAEKCNANPESDVKDKHKKKKKKKDKTKGKKDDSPSAKKISTASLEWDHGCSSSGSDSLVDDKVPSPTATDPRFETSKNTSKDHHMEWDPSGCTMKNSPSLPSAPNQSSPAPDWEPYATDEGRSSSAANTMSRPTAHISNDVSFDHASGELDTELISQINGTQNIGEVNDNEDDKLGETLPLDEKKSDVKLKKDKMKKKQINGKVKKPKKKDKTKEKVTS